MTLAFHLREAHPQDLRAVEEMLRAAALPLAGVAEHFARFHVACVDASIVGAAGFELHDGVALLRSIVVRADYRQRGVGAALTTRALEAAPVAGAREVYLLTTTAPDYFARSGFEPVARAHLPAALSASAELQGACPASATAMRWVRRSLVGPGQGS